MDEFEDRLRRGLSHYAAAMRVARPPLGDLVSGPAPFARPSQARRRVVAGLALAATAVTVVAAMQLRSTTTEPDEARIDTSPETPQRSAGASPNCPPRTATDGIVATGQIGDGRTWEVQVSGVPPAVRTALRVDGIEVGAGYHDQISWATVVNQGFLMWHLEASADGVLVSGEVPRSAAWAEVGLADGRAVTLCPTGVPGIEPVAYVGGGISGQVDVAEVAVFDRDGRQLAHARVDQIPVESGEPYGLGFSVQLDRELVPLPLEGDEWPSVDRDEMTVLASGQLPNGEWRLLAGAEEDVVAYTVDLPGSAEVAGSTGTEETLFTGARWHINWVDGRHFVSGLTRADVTTVVVGMDDGSTVEVQTVDGSAVGLEGRLFAMPLPEGAAPTNWDARTADGTVVEGADGVADAFAEVTQPNVGTALPVRAAT
jgi:hypothetical protein